MGTKRQEVATSRRYTKDQKEQAVRLAGVGSRW
jgi:hypothetical protein